MNKKRMAVNIKATQKNNKEKWQRQLDVKVKEHKYVLFVPKERGDRQNYIINH